MKGHNGSGRMLDSLILEPVTDGSTVAGTNATRASFTNGAGTAIPRLIPAWSSDNATAFSVPYLNPAAFRLPAAGEYGQTGLR